jgi:hypothetical protein
MPRVKLTRTVIDALPTPSKDLVHWDTGCPGFGVNVTPKGPYPDDRKARICHALAYGSDHAFRASGRPGALRRARGRGCRLDDALESLESAFPGRMLGRCRLKYVPRTIAKGRIDIALP